MVVRDALHALTGSNSVQGFDEGKMACALETLEEILNHLHREFIHPNYFVKHAADRRILEQVS